MSNDLYANLLKLTETSEAFYFMDYGPYRVFNYRLASYTDFLAPDALEARGIMFYMEEGKEPLLVCRPFKKFFNVDENPFTMNLDFSKVTKVAIKEDGSIISSYLDVPTKELRLKSKQSLVSEQTKMANDFINRPENVELKRATNYVTQGGCTVIFELVSPANRIVLEYPKTELRVLAVRVNETGELLKKDILGSYVGVLASSWTHEEPFVDPGTVPTMTGIEGYVYTFEDGTMAKLKTDWYKTLHHLKDSVDTPGRLFDAIIDERVDDVKAMFATDDYTLTRIKEMEELVVPKFNHIVKTVEDFYVANKDLTRKDFAIKGQAELKSFFSLGMTRYLGKEVDFKYFAKKYRDEHFGVTNVEKDLVTE